MEMLSLDLSGDSPSFGPIMLRESPTKQSLGKHTIAAGPARLPRQQLFRCVPGAEHDDGQTWYPANRSMRVLPSLPPAVPGSIFASHIGTSIVVQWQNNFTLQSTPSLKVPFTDVEGPRHQRFLHQPDEWKRDVFPVASVTIPQTDAIQKEDRASARSFL